QFRIVGHRKRQHSTSVPTPIEASKAIAARDLDRELECVLIRLTSRIAKEYGCETWISARVSELNENLGRLMTHWNLGRGAVKQQLLGLLCDRRCNVRVRVTSAADAMAAIEIKIIASSRIEDPIPFPLYEREWKRRVSGKQRR